jgi:hypothetical protein
MIDRQGRVGDESQHCNLLFEGLSIDDGIIAIIFLGGVRLSQLGISATVWPVVSTSDDR